MPMQELIEWQIFYTLEPWGEWRNDLRAGMMVAPIINMFSSKGSKKAKPNDWVMRFEPLPEQSIEEMKFVLMAFAAVNEKRC